MKTELFNIPLDVLNRAEALKKCGEFLAGDKCRTICFLNAHCFNVAQEDTAYAQAIRDADLLLHDGIGLKVVSVIAGVSLQDNLNGTDFIPAILELAARADAPVYFLGGREGIAEKAAQNIQAKSPGLHIAGYRSGFFDASDEHEVLAAINRTDACVVVLGMGVPRQELWAQRNRENLPKVRLLISGGAILDFISGTIPRAPLWVRRLRLEWLFRLCLEPRRMWRRYIVGSFVLLGHVVRLLRVKRCAA
jgi:N-acetylglucosaminyldiphosphoundecaprenol N-acetyl-beta-D-mannosaminyltransferase